jgi:hypothetical protein
MGDGAGGNCDVEQDEEVGEPKAAADRGGVLDGFAPGFEIVCRRRLRAGWRCLRVFCSVRRHFPAFGRIDPDRESPAVQT